MKQEEIDSMINAMGKEMNEQEKLIRNLAKAVLFMGTNKKLTIDDIIEEFSKKEITDEFMERWEKSQWKESHLKDEVIDLMAEDIPSNIISDCCIKAKELELDCYADMYTDNEACKECVKEFYFKKARGEEK